MPAMSTLAEIEAAVDSLTPSEIEKLESLLRERRTRQEEAQMEELYRRIGYVPLPKREGQPVTREMVRQLRDEENI